MLLHTPGCYFTHPSTSSAIVSHSLHSRQQVSCPYHWSNIEQHFVPKKKFFEMPPKLMNVHGTHVREWKKVVNYFQTKRIWMNAVRENHRFYTIIFSPQLVWPIVITHSHLTPPNPMKPPREPIIIKSTSTMHRKPDRTPTLSLRGVTVNHHIHIIIHTLRLSINASSPSLKMS